MCSIPGEVLEQRQRPFSHRTIQRRCKMEYSVNGECSRKKKKKSVAKPTHTHVHGRSFKKLHKALHFTNLENRVPFEESLEKGQEVI